jgi:hypothetical protein
MEEHLRNSVLNQAYLFPEIKKANEYSPKKTTAHNSNMEIHQESSPRLHYQKLPQNMLRNVDIPIIDSTATTGFKRISKSKACKNIRNFNYLYDAREQSEKLRRLKEKYKIGDGMKTESS